MSTTSQSLVTTPSPACYGKQLASHFGHKMATSWDAEVECGVLRFDNPEFPVCGECTLTAESGALHLAATADDAEAMEAVERVVGVHLVRFGQREGLVCQWTRDDGGEVVTFTMEDVEKLSKERGSRTEGAPRK